MRIIELCLSPGMGGLELYAFDAICHLRERGHQILPVVRRDSLLDRKLAAAGIERVYLDIKWRIWPLRAAVKLARMVRDFRADVIHMHWAKDLPLAALCKRRLHSQVRLVHYRTMDLTRPKKDYYHRLLYQQVDCFLACTRRVYEAAQKFLPLRHEQIAYLYLCIDDFEPVDSTDCVQFRHQQGLQDEAFRVGLFGRIEPKKGQHLLIDALASLTRQGREVQAIIIGAVMDQDYADGLRQRVTESGLDQRVTFLPFLDQAKRWMSCFDAVVLTTDKETFGLVLVEGMVAGVPVIGSRAGGVTEIIDHEQTGLLFESGNGEDLAQALSYLIDHPRQAQAIAQAGQQKARRLFLAPRHFDELENILKGNQS